MQLTPHKQQVIELVSEGRILTAAQVATAVYPSGSKSRCQFDLRTLVDHRYIDRIEPQLVNQPHLYLLTRRSFRGNRLIKQLYGDDEFSRRMTRLGLADHQLAINEVWVRIIAGSRNLGFTLKLWFRPEQLVRLIPRHSRLTPDAYFQIQRPSQDGNTKASAFFVEMERSHKSDAVLNKKLLNYSQFLYSGAYQDTFSLSAMRILIIFTDNNPRRIQRALQHAENLGFNRPCFATLPTLCSPSPQELLTAPIWQRVGQTKPVALFQLTG